MSEQHARVQHRTGKLGWLIETLKDGAHIVRWDGDGYRSREAAKTIQLYPTPLQLTQECRRALPRFHGGALVPLRTVLKIVREELMYQGLIHDNFAEGYLQAHPCADGYICDPSSFTA